MDQRNLQIFISYADADKRYCKELSKHLAPLETGKQISIWSRRKLVAGVSRKDVIEKKLQGSDIILFLISSDFFDLYYSNDDNEVKKALELVEKKKAVGVPVLLRPYSIENTPLGPNSMNGLPKNGNAITSGEWSSIDAALKEVVEGLEEVISKIREREGGSTSAVDQFHSSEDTQEKASQSIESSTEERTPEPNPGSHNRRWITGIALAMLIVMIASIFHFFGNNDDFIREDRPPSFNIFKNTANGNDAPVDFFDIYDSYKLRDIIGEPDNSSKKLLILYFKLKNDHLEEYDQLQITLNPEFFNNRLGQSSLIPSSDYGDFRLVNTSGIYVADVLKSELQFEIEYYIN